MATILTPELDKQIEAVMASGQFSSTEEALQRAIELLVEEQKVEHLRAIVTEAKAEIARGGVYELTPGLIEKINADACEMVQNGILPDPEVWPTSR